MYIKNISSKDISIVIEGISYNFKVGIPLYIPDALIYHPSLQAILSKFQIDTGGTISTSSINEALNNAKNPSKYNYFATYQDLQEGLSLNAKEHHSNANDPSTNEKEAMTKSEGASGTNPFSTLSATEDSLAASMEYHITHYDHTPSPLTENEIAGLHASTLPGTDNAYSTLSVVSSICNSQISTHAGNPTAHHSNANDPSSGQKLALVGTYGTPGTSNKFVTNDHMNIHIATPTAHHSNLNDPTNLEKIALGGTYGTLSVSNKFVTSTDPRMLSSDQIAGISATPISASDPIVASSDVRLDTSTHPTAGQKLALIGTSGTPTTGNEYVTSTDPRVLTLAASQGVQGAIGLSGSNPVITVANLAAHTATASAHHSNANDPSTGEKAALVGTSGTVGSSNKFVTNDHMTTHIAVASAHHSNANDPSADEKGALGGTSGTPGALNKFVTDSDTRMTNSRAPTAHAASHVGSDIIQSCSSTQSGLMTATLVKTLLNNINDIRLQYTSTSSLTLVGILTKNIHLNNTPIEISSLVVTTSDYLLDDEGILTEDTPLASTMYYVYTNGTLLRLSPYPGTWDATQAKYLLGTYMLVGWCHTNSSIEFLDSFSVASLYNDLSTSLTKVGTLTAVSVASTWEHITGLNEGILLPPGYTLQIYASVICKGGTSDTVCNIGINSEIMASSNIDSIYRNISGTKLYTSTLAYTDYYIDHFFVDATGAYTDGSRSFATFIRKPN